MGNQTNLATKQAPLASVFPHRTRNGYSFDPSADYWRFSTNSGTRNFDLVRLESLCAPGFALSVRKTLSWYLENRSVPHANNLFRRLLHFLETIGAGAENKISSITDIMIMNYRESLLEQDEDGKVLGRSKEWYLGSLRGFFLRLARLGYPGVERQAVNLLEEIRLEGNRKGWAVLTMDENEGPFTDMELRLIQGAFRKSFSEGILSLRQFVLVGLLMALGPRSSQVSDLKVKDLEVSKPETGPASFTLHVPRVKQRNVKRREQFKRREIGEAVGKALEALCKQVVEDLGSKVADVRELPVFPIVRKTVKAEPGFEFHTDSNSIRRELKGMFQELNIISPRTNEPLKAPPRRFRYTLGTRAVIHKAGAMVIADLLDHSDTQNVQIYTKLSDEVIEELDAELSDDMEPLAQAFRGEIVLFEDGDLSDPSKLIAYPGIEPQKGYEGKCRCGGECGDVPPIFCYPCEHFTAFKDAPHEEVLKLMLAEKDKELELGNDVVAGELDESIAACRAVIKKCQEMKEVR